MAVKSHYYEYYACLFENSNDFPINLICFSDIQTYAPGQLHHN